MYRCGSAHCRPPELTLKRSFQHLVTYSPFTILTPESLGWVKELRMLRVSVRLVTTWLFGLWRPENSARMPKFLGLLTMLNWTHHHVAATCPTCRGFKPKMDFL